MIITEVVNGKTVWGKVTTEFTVTEDGSINVGKDSEILLVPSKKEKRELKELKYEI